MKVLTRGMDLSSRNSSSKILLNIRYLGNERTKKAKEVLKKGVVVLRRYCHMIFCHL